MSGFVLTFVPTSLVSPTAVNLFLAVAVSFSVLDGIAAIQ